MSQLLWNNVKVGVINVDFNDPNYFDSGIPLVADDLIAVENGGVIDHYHQGLPFTAAGRLSVDINGTVNYFGSGAAPFNSIGQLCFGTGPVDHYSHGIPYTVANQIKTT